MREAGRSFGPHVDGSDGEWAKLGRLVKTDPELAWRTLLEVVATTDEDGLFWVADIVEDLILAGGAPFVDVLEPELLTNRPLRRAFVRVVPMNADERVEERVLALRERIEAEDLPTW